MPRWGNTRSRKTFHHHAMQSAAPGKGLSAKLRKKKRDESLAWAVKHGFKRKKKPKKQPLAGLSLIPLPLS
jgi:hypothetical protein